MNAPIDLQAMPRPRTVADLVSDFGNIPLNRIRLSPPIGTATVDDLERNEGCELIDGTLVEKAMGLRESILAVFLCEMLNGLIRPRNLGVVSGEQGTLQILTGLVRIPDVAFVSWDRCPGRRIPEEPVPALVPDLAVEILSEGNTPEEMERKRGEYFEAGVRIVWEVDRFKRIVTVYTSPSDSLALGESDTLDGGAVLPDFALSVRDIFAELDRLG